MPPTRNLESSQSKNMSDPTAELHVSTGGTWIRRAALLGLGLALVLHLGFSALDYVVPRSLDPDRSAFTRAGWYLRSGQWHADVKTLVCALEYVMTPEATTPGGTSPPNQQLTAPSRPIGP